MTSTDTPARPVLTATVGEGTATVTYDVHGDLTAATAGRPTLFLLGSPMDATGFAALAAHVTDRPVVTYDPRGSGRNPTDTTDISVDDHAGDLLAVVEAVRAAGSGPVDVLASSGGAVNVLRLLETRPDVLRRVVAHEPPTAELLPDRDQVLAACADVKATYDRAGAGQAMAKFVALVVHDGEVGVDWTERPAPDPAHVGMSADDDGTRTHPLMRNFPGCNRWAPDVEALTALGDRVVLAVGAESGEGMAARGARSVAAALGRDAVTFPGGHGGFLGEGHGQSGDPAGFAARLLDVLS